MALPREAPEFVSWNGREYRTNKTSTTHEQKASPARQRETGTWEDPDWSILDDRRGALPEFPVDGGRHPRTPRSSANSLGCQTGLSASTGLKGKSRRCKID